MSGNKKLAEARILAAKQVPYLRSGLMSLVPVERPGLGTMAMDQYGRLYFDRAFLEARNLKDCAFVVVHEYVHFHQRHALRQRSVVKGDAARLKVWRSTVEGPTNEIAESAFGWCPEEATTSAKLGLPRNLTVEEAFAFKWKERCDAQQRAEEERKRQEEAEKANQDADDEQDDEQDEPNTEQEWPDTEELDDDQEGDSPESGSDEPEAADDHDADQGQEGDSDDAETTGDGEADDDGDESDEDGEAGDGDESQDGQGAAEGEETSEGGQGEGSGEDSASDGDDAGGSDDGGSGPEGKGEGQGQGESLEALSAEAISQLAGEIGGSASDGIDRPWELGPPSEESPGLDENDQKMIEAVIAKAIEQHIAARGVGSVPDPLAKQASELLHKPVDPCRELAAMTKYAVDTIAGFGEFTYSRASNRHIPGGCIMPTAVKPIPRITLIIDSSGSMGSDDTALALEVLGSVLKNLPDPRGLRVLVGGTRVEAARRVFKPDQIDVLDGGGTDMGRLIRQADQERPAPKVIICVSDGETPWCAEQDVQAKVMVCLTRRPHWCSPPPAWMKTVCLHPAAD